MNCPQCNSKLESIKSIVDNQQILICSSSDCQYEQLPTEKEIPCNKELPEYKSNLNNELNRSS